MTWTPAIAWARAPDGSLRPECLFLATALLSGLVLSVLNPPMQGPDEGAHLRRAYQLSEGQVLAHGANGDLGGELPVSLRTGALREWGRICLHPERRVTRQAIDDLLAEPLAPSTIEFMDFRNTAVYSPVPYLPQALILAPARLAEARPVLLLYLARFAGFAAWSGLVFFAIRATPAGKWSMAMVALSPVAMVQGTVLNADSVTNGLGFVTLALGLRVALGPRGRHVGWREVCVFTLASALLAVCKFVYAPLVLLILALERERTASAKQHAAMLGFAIGVTAIAWLGWSIAAARLRLPPVPLQPVLGGQSPTALHSGRAAVLLSAFRHPLDFVAMVARTAIHDRVWVRGMSWVDWNVVLPGAFTWAGFVLLIAVAIVDTDPEHPVSARLRVLAATAALLSLLGAYLIHFMMWTVPGDRYIGGVHGRYAIPVAPAMLLALGAGRAAKARRFLPLAMVGFGLLSMGVTSWALLERYYFP